MNRRYEVYQCDMCKLLVTVVSGGVLPDKCRCGSDWENWVFINDLWHDAEREPLL